MTIKKILSSFILSCLIFVGFALLPTTTLGAPKVYLDPTNQNASKDTDFQVRVLIDTETRPAFGADVILTYPSGDLTVKSITNGGFFTDLSSGQSSGRLELHGFFSTLYGTKSGSGTFATISFSSNKESGTGNLAILCNSNGTESQILDSEGNNILSCSSVNGSTISYLGSSSSNNNSSNSNDNSGSNEPNSCNGTCGSHSNCKAGLFCSSGFCRNPDCPGTTTCGCSATAKPQGTVKPKVSSTPQVITLAEYTPYPSPIEESTDEATLEPRQIDLKTLGIITLLTALALILTSWIIKMAKTSKKANSEIKNPPSETPPVTF